MFRGLEFGFRVDRCDSGALTGLSHAQVADKTEEFKNQMNWVTGLVEVELPME